MTDPFEPMRRAAPELCFEAGHCRGYPAMLVRLDIVPPTDLARRPEIARRRKAQKRLVAELDARRSGSRSLPGRLPDDI